MPIHYLFARARYIGTAAWLLGLVFSLPITSYTAFNQAYANDKTDNTLSESQCRNLNLSLRSTTSEEPLKRAVIRQMERFESAITSGDSEIFAQLASKALQKKPHELRKLFDGTLSEYGLKRAKLQRNSVWEMKLSDSHGPGQLLNCGDLQIAPVFGPKSQIAVFYSHFSRNEQTKLLLFFAQTQFDTVQPENLGIVMMQVQRWTYDGKSPEKIFQQSLAQESNGQILTARLLADAAAKIMESNPYTVMPLQLEAREKAEQLRQKETAQLQALFNDVSKQNIFTPELLEPTFRDGTLAVGLKVRVGQELALNTQLKLCRLAGKKIFPKSTSWRAEFSGFECLLYEEKESMAQQPRAGSKFFNWELLDSK